MVGVSPKLNHQFPKPYHVYATNNKVFFGKKPKNNLLRA
jgi:hypothetical protein